MVTQPGAAISVAMMHGSGVGWGNPGGFFAVFLSGNGDLRPPRLPPCALTPGSVTACTLCSGEKEIL